MTTPVATRITNRGQTKSGGVEMNLAAVLILPMLEKSYRDWCGIIKDVYIGDYLKPEFSQNIMVLVNCKSPYYSNVLDECKRNTYFITTYSCDENLEMIVFKVPPHFEEDYSLFLKGRYSHLSQRLKDLVLGKATSGEVYTILYRSADYRKYLEEYFEVTLPKDAEVIDAPNLELEIYNYK